MTETIATTEDTELMSSLNFLEIGVSATNKHHIVQLE